MSNIIPYQSLAPKIDPTVFVAPSGTVVGDVTIGEGSSVWFNAVIRGDFQKVTIGKNSNVQDNATVHVMWDTPTEIGDNVVIGAGTMITQHKKIPSNSLVYGNPAQIVRSLREDELEAVHASALNYRKVAETYKAELL